MNPSRPILTAEQMKACDEYTIEQLKIPSPALMLRAARAAAVFLCRRQDLFPPKGKVVILCGSGNNGGDGMAMARLLTDGSLSVWREVVVIYTGAYTPEGVPDIGRMSAGCMREYAATKEAGVPILPVSEAAKALKNAVAVVDAVFGIGLDRPVAGEIASLLTAVSEARLPVLAVDVPSGVNANTGKVMGVALPAKATVTMQALKAGLLLYPGADLCGEIHVADLGIDLSTVEKPFAHLADEALLRRVLPPRPRRTHKGTYGRLLLFCGSEGMSGAAVLATKAALRSGVGLADVIAPVTNYSAIQNAIPEAILSLYGLEVKLNLSRPDGLVMGCGIGQTATTKNNLRNFLEGLAGFGTLPTVLDADSLNLLAEDKTLWKTALLADPVKQVVITPHPLEMSRLCGETVDVILSRPVKTAVDFARRRGVTVVLKDAHTVIASPDGDVFICAAGNAGMATGGSGDVLAGVIGALLAQNRSRLGTELTAAQVAAAGVYLHAAAGDLAAAELGEYGMLPSDIIGKIPLICKEFSDSRTVIS